MPSMLTALTALAPVGLGIVLDVDENVDARVDEVVDEEVDDESVEVELFPPAVSGHVPNKLWHPVPQ